MILSEQYIFYSIGFTKSTSKFWRQINEGGGGNFNAGFVKLTLYNIFLYILFKGFD